ncbi:MAG TPA: GNAT family N-acetyltransferase, partial [Ardenticatenaceae bacterium]|nr:GNAT family N-acetyltransferase [Ardenticatenaceae bacterium]
EDQGRIVGVGQVKPHRDGTRELASIAVIPERQGCGIGSAIIHALMAREQGPLYLTTNFPLEGYYRRFGFVRVEPKEMPSSLWWIYRISALLAPLTRLFIAGGVRIIVMKRGG